MHSLLLKTLVFQSLFSMPSYWSVQLQLVVGHWLHLRDDIVTIRFFGRGTVPPYFVFSSLVLNEFAPTFFPLYILVLQQTPCSYFSHLPEYLGPGTPLQLVCHITSKHLVSSLPIFEPYFHNWLQARRCITYFFLFPHPCHYSLQLARSAA